ESRIRAGDEGRGEANPGLHTARARDDGNRADVSAKRNAVPGGGAEPRPGGLAQPAARVPGLSQYPADDVANHRTGAQMVRGSEPVRKEPGGTGQGAKIF